MYYYCGVRVKGIIIKSKRKHLKSIKQIDFKTCT